MARRQSTGRTLRSARVRLEQSLRTWTLPILVVFAGLSVVMLLLGRGTSEYGQNLAMNLSAEFIGALVVIFALTPILQRAQQGRVREHRHLDFAWYTDRVIAATTSVRVLHTFSRLFSPPFDQRFYSAAAGLLLRGGTVRILLMNPDSVAAAQRTTELAGHGDVGLESRRNLQTLDAFRRSLDEACRSRFEVRLYAASASVQIYQWDDRLLASFLPLGRLSGDHSQLEVPVDSPLGSFVTERFDDLWERSVSVAEYWRTRVTLLAGEGSSEYSTRFLALDDRVYLADSRVVAYLARCRDRSVDAVLPQASEAVYQVDVVTDDQPEATEVRLRFLEKYGSGESVFVRLSRRDGR